MRSCSSNCPSRLAAGEEQVAFLGRRQDFGAPICGRFGYVLERPGQSEAVNVRIGEKRAGDCEFHGQSLPENPPDSLNSQVGLPLFVPARIEPAPGTNKPTSCTACINFVPAEVVEKELGWTVPLCLAQAKLLAPARLVHEATAGYAGQACPYSKIGPNATTTEGRMALLPLFDGGVAVASTAPRNDNLPNYDPTRFIATDPRAYETDLPVTPEHAAAGIRAWRLVPDPKGVMEPVAMPVFDGEKLCGFDPRSTYGEHSPHLYLDHQGLLYTWAAFSMGGIDPSGRGLNKCLALTGPAGTGKTEFFAFVAWLMDLPLYVISCRPDMSPFELIGGNALVPTDDGTSTVTKFVPGRFLSNFDKPCVMVLDEFASLPDEAWFSLRGVFVGGKNLTVEEHGLSKAQGGLTFIGLATNPDWDPAYRGVRPLSPADKQRFPWLEVSLPDENIERKIIKSHCEDLGYTIPDHTLDTIMLIGNELRDTIKESQLELSWGIRMNVSVAQSSWMFTLEDSYRTAMLDALDPNLRDTLITIVKSHTDS